MVLGDRYGTSCVPAVSETVETTLRGFGYAVSRNKPYAGGFITEHYGNPAAGLHAIQLEINRALYMDERRFERSADFDRLAAGSGDAGRPPGRQSRSRSCGPTAPRPNKPELSSKRSAPLKRRAACKQAAQVLGRKRPRRAAGMRSEDRNAALHKYVTALHKKQVLLTYPSHSC